MVLSEYVNNFTENRTLVIINKNNKYYELHLTNYVCVILYNSPVEA